jgi:Vitamin K-dependent gamma-carboxylase
VTRVFAAAERWLFSPEIPAQRLGSLRILVCGFGTIYLLARAPHLTDFSRLPASDFAPVGLAVILSQPIPSALALLLFGVTAVAGIAASLGLRYRVSGPLYALGLLWVTSYRNSWGMIFHTENLLVLHTLILGVSPAADGMALGSPNVKREQRQQTGEYAWAVRALSIVTVLSYVIAGVAKLDIAGLHWATGHELRTQIAFDALRKIELGSLHSSVGAWLVQFDSLFTPLAWLTLALELGAPCALLGRWPALIWCVGVWGFHLGVLLLMLIVFPYPLSGLAMASFFAPEKLINWVARRRGPRRE